ncbi:MAG: J domain-containing protein [Prochloraceae cyanobacterium]
MLQVNHYQILEVSHKATHQEIKQAYRRLVKRFHPDSGSQTADREKIVEVNAAYEVLGDPQLRRSYDLQLTSQDLYRSTIKRQQRTADAQNQYQRSRQKVKEEEAHQRQWLKEVYIPINRILFLILDPLEDRIEELSADPFDDRLMAAFENYLENCRNYLDRAQQTLASQPNPTKLAAIAAPFYHCINQISDGLDELQWFTLNYNERYLHTGQELFRIARGLHSQAREVASLFI